MSQLGLLLNTKVNVLLCFSYEEKHKKSGKDDEETASNKVLTSLVLVIMCI